jgi:hypothetical protein
LPGNQAADRAPDADAHPPAFLITIDTEGDNAWSRTPQITTRNSAFLERFQQLCEKHRLKPTYLTNWEMAQCPDFQRFGRQVLDTGQAEIGMHLHAWNNPPIEPLTEDDHRYLPYLIEYPPNLMREKLARITALLEDTFSRKMVSHRAGRWAFSEIYASLLVELGYLVDCSVTPHVSWVAQPGAPGGSGGTDYRGFPDEAYWIHLSDLRRPGDSPLLEIPLTIIPRPRYALAEAVRRLVQPVGPARRALKRYFPAEWRFRAVGGNRSQLLAILNIARQQRRDHVEFMMHSSEFMPGGSPTFPSAADIESMYEDLEALFTAASNAGFVGMTLHEYYQRFRHRDGDH